MTNTNKKNQINTKNLPVKYSPATPIVLGKNDKKEIEHIIKNSFEYKMYSYTGSKNKFQDQFLNVLNRMNGGETINVKYYIEGFSGSLMSMFHNLKMVNPEIIIINDINEKLINLYIQIKNNPELVYEGYKMLEDKFNSYITEDIKKVRIYPKEKRGDIRKCETMYKYIREQVNTIELDWLHSSCMLFILNHNFRGNYSENKKGHINISFNWKTQPVDIDNIKNSLFNLSEFFNSREVIFECLDIDDLVLKYNHHDTFIYLDPPYIDSDVQYNKKRKKGNSFNELKVHQKLLDSLDKYKYIMYSNNHHDDFISKCDGFVNFNRGKFGGKKDSKKTIKEILTYKINHKTPVNNTDYDNTPEVNEVEVLKTGTDNLEVIQDSGNNNDYIPVDSEYNFSLGTCFSGLGCPEYVLKELKVPHTTEFVCDIDKFCRQTLIRNYNPKRVFEDITELSIDKLQDTYIDLYVWGSPCQDISLSNNSRQGLKGEKSKLFYEGLRILEETQPKYCIFENVQGLLSSNNGEDFKEVMRLFNELGIYDIYWKKINPISIGGNTNRIRVFGILIRKDIGIKFNFPKETGTTKSIKDCIIEGEYKYYNKNEYIPWKTPIERQRGKLRKDFRITTISRQEQQRVFNINYPAPTIQRSGVVHINDGKGVRKMVPEELKLIQGLDNLDMSHLSDTQKKSQLGNTMEVETMKKLIGEIVRIDKIHYNKQKQQLKKVS